MEKDKILLIEKDFLIVEDIKSYFISSGFDVFNLDSIDSSLSFLENNKIDVIFANLGIIEDENLISFSELVSKRFNVNIIYVIDENEKRTFFNKKSEHPISYITKPYLIDDLGDLVKKEIYYGRLQKQLASTDIELQKLKSNNLNKNENHTLVLYKAIVDTLDTPIILFDKDNVICLNTSAIELFGLRRFDDFYKKYKKDDLKILEKDNKNILKLENSDINFEKEVYLSNLNIKNNIFTQVYIYNANDDDERKEIDKTINKKLYYFRQNLQLFSSLFSLELKNIKFFNKEIYEHFMFDFNRFRVVLLLYSFIPNEDKINSLTFKDYLIRISNHLYHIHQISYSNLKLEIKFSNYEIDYTSILTYGLIINEILAIIMMYSFKKNEDLDLSQKFIKIESDFITNSCMPNFNIRYNCKDITKFLNTETDLIFSLKIIEELSKQLNYKIIFKSYEDENIIEMLPL